MWKIREFQEMHPGFAQSAGRYRHAGACAVHRICPLLPGASEVLRGAGVKKVEYSMDCESLLRGAFLSAWCDEVKQGTAHSFYVRHAKYRTVTEREMAKKEARMRLKVFQESLPEDHRQ